MNTVLHIGRTRVVTITTSDGSTLVPGALSVSTSDPAIATATVDPATNVTTVTGTGPGTASVTFSAAGYQTTFENFNVSPLPTLIPVIGPEV